MTSREKFFSVMRMPPGEAGDGVQVPKVEFGYWAGTVRRWLTEGLPEREPVPEALGLHPFQGPVVDRR